MRCAWLLSVLLLTSCVSTHMSGYLGKEISEVVLMEGQPINVLELPDGRRGYQYIFGTVIGSTTGTTVSERKSETSAGKTANTKVTTTGNASAAYSAQGCLVTYIARQQGDAWIVEDFRYPSRIVC